MLDNDELMAKIVDALRVEDECLRAEANAKEPTIVGQYLGNIEPYAAYHEVGSPCPPQTNHLQIALDASAEAFIQQITEEK